jgi:hypothetical protein
MKEILRKISSLKLNLMVHPDNQPNSEFEDRISDLEAIDQALKSGYYKPFGNKEQTQIKDKNGHVAIKYDPSTLPKDGQKIEYRDTSGVWHFGHYIAEEQLFFCSKKEWHHVIDVDVWVVTSRK